MDQVKRLLMRAREHYPGSRSLQHKWVRVILANPALTPCVPIGLPFKTEHYAFQRRASF